MTDAEKAARAAGIREALQAIADLPTGRSEDVMEGQEQSYRAVEARLDASAPAEYRIDPATLILRPDLQRICDAARSAPQWDTEQDRMKSAPAPEGFATSDAEGQWVRDTDAGVYDTVTPAGAGVTVQDSGFSGALIDAICDATDCRPSEARAALRALSGDRA